MAHHNIFSGGTWGSTMTEIASSANLPPKGILIALEGIDGAGKTTTVSNVVNTLIRRGYTAAKFTNSSGYTPYWQTVMEAKGRMARRGNDIPPDIDQSLHAFEFLTYCKTALPELLYKHQFVLSDRYALGKQVLSELDTGRKNSWTEMMLQDALESGTIPKPDLSIYLAIDPQSARNRIEARGGSIEKKESLELLTVANSIFKRRLSTGSLIQLSALTEPERLAESIADIALGAYNGRITPKI